MKDNEKKIRRRASDHDWSGATERAPWDGPSSQWGEDVNTRLGALEIAVLGDKETGEKGLLGMTQEMYSVFRPGKKGLLVAAAVAAFLGWSGVAAIWHWVSEHLR